MTNSELEARDIWLIGALIIIAVSSVLILIHSAMEYTGAWTDAAEEALRLIALGIGAAILPYITGLVAVKLMEVADGS